jgi:hypothetical protein
VDRRSGVFSQSPRHSHSGYAASVHVDGVLRAGVHDHVEVLFVPSQPVDRRIDDRCFVGEETDAAGCRARGNLEVLANGANRHPNLHGQPRLALPVSIMFLPA